MYGNSLASSKDINLLYPSSSFKHSEVEEELQKQREVMDSNLNQHQQQQQLNSRLMRYRSAPSSLLANFVDNGGESERCEDFLHPRSSSPEAESMFARFMSCGGGGDSAPADLCEIEEKTTVAAAVNQRNSQFMSSMEHEAEVIPQQNGYSPASQMIYQTRPPPPLLPNHSSAAMENSYRVVNSISMEHHHPQVKTASRNSPNLIRHSSSPAGLFSHLTVENGYGVMRGMGNFRGRNGTNGEVAPSSSRLKGQINFSSPGPPSSSGLMSQISEIESDSICTTSPDDGSLASSNDGSRCFIPGFPIGSWDDSALVSENFTGLKRLKNANGKIISVLNQSETQNGETGNHTPLTHHFSLPKTSAEMATMEKFLQFQDSVPCKIRAKRGCATHPRSIAERVRRTRISERMRKLQELVPNMDKQTNTADMLDLAVDYIKDLQKQVKTLSDLRTSCTCSSKQKTYSNPTV